jgi:hypothetical protein
MRAGLTTGITESPCPSDLSGATRRLTANPLWVILHVPGFVVNRPGFVLFAAYPLIPWVGVTAVGYVLGRISRWIPGRRKPPRPSLWYRSPTPRSTHRRSCSC